MLGCLHNIRVSWKYLYEPISCWVCGFCLFFFFSSSLDEIWILLTSGNRVETGRSWLSISGGVGLHMCLTGKLSSCGRKQQSCPLKRGRKQCHHILNQTHESDFFLRSYRANNFKLGKRPPKQISRNIGGQSLCVFAHVQAAWLQDACMRSHWGEKKREGLEKALSLIVAVLNSFKLWFWLLLAVQIGILKLISP